MTLNLEILSTTTIKRKKPWSKTLWLGKEKEQLVLLDSRRLSYLQLHNGETKKNIGQLTRYLTETIKLYCHDENIVALLFNGDILIWNKDLDVIYVVKGLPGFALTSKKKTDKKSPSSSNGDIDKKRYDICLNPNMKSLVVIEDFNSIYIWYCDKPLPSSPSSSKKTKELTGTWFNVPLDNEVSLPNVTEHKNAILTTSFNKNHLVLSSPSFRCVYLYTSEDTLRVPILSINPTYTYLPKRHDTNNICVWKNLTFPLKEIHSECDSIQHSGALVATLSHDGLTLVVALNQLATHAAKLIFISMLNGSMVSISLKNYSIGQPVTVRKKYLWISDMSWSFDDCFIVCITKDGSVCVASQLGELLQIRLTGCSLKLGPAFYPNLYPLVRPSSTESVSSQINANDDVSVSTVSGNINFRQRFSVSSHPTVPLFLLSDGYLVTLIRFPQINVGHVETSSWFLQEAKVALKPFRQLTGRRDYSQSKTKASLNVKDMKDSWKILSNVTEDSTTVNAKSDWDCRQLNVAASNVVCLWGLLSCFNNPWKKPLYILATKSIDLIEEMVEISLSHHLAFMTSSTTPFHSVVELTKVLFERIAFDGALFNMLPTSFILLNRIVAQLSKNANPERITMSIKFLLEMERYLLKIYEVKLARNTENENENENYQLQDFYCYGNFSSLPSDDKIEFTEVTTCERLKPAWFTLYKEVIANYKDDEIHAEEWREILCVIQSYIQERGWELRLKKIKKKIDPAAKFYLKGHVERATDIWLTDIKKNKKLINSRSLHRILYSLLSQYKMAASFTFVFGFLTGNYPNDDKSGVLCSIMKQLDCQHVTNLLNSFSRIWLSYCDKKCVQIYPVHRAHAILPQKHSYKGLRGCSLITPVITDSLSTQKCDMVTNPASVLEMLLFGGLWFEAVSFLFSQNSINRTCEKQLQFRMAFALTSIWYKTNQLIWRARSSPFTAEIEPQTIILEQLKLLPTNKDSKQTEECSEEFVSKIRDLLLPAVICNLDLTPVILEDIVHQLYKLIEKSTLLVPNETYLPAPPIYCPQQSIGYEEGDMPSEDTEDGFRHAVATLIERFFCVVQASFLGFPLMAWYFSFVEKLWASAGWNSFGEMAFSNLQFTIVTYLEINSSSPEIADAIQWVTLETSEGGQRCLQSLRNLLSLIWMLNCRDELSIACRNMHKFILGGETKTNFKNPDDYFTILDQILYWSEKISSFRVVLTSQTTLENIIFNSVTETVLSEDLIARITRCFPNSEILSLSGQNQLSNLVIKFDNYLSNSSSSSEIKTFEGFRSKEMEKRKLLGQRISKQFKKCPALKITQFEDYCFEIEDEFLNYIEPVFHIGILKRLSNPQSSANRIRSIPLLTTFSKQLRHEHFLSPNDAIKSLVQLERNYSNNRESLLELIEESNTSVETLNFLKTPGKRSSVLFRQPIGSFWSPSRRVLEKFHKLVTEVRGRERSQRFKTNRNRHNISGKACSKWKSSANLLMEELKSNRNPTITNLKKSVSVTNLFSQTSSTRLVSRKVKGYANKIPDLVVELQMKSNEDESLLPFVSWILTWASFGSISSSGIHLLPSHILMALVLESRRKARLKDDGSLSLVRVKIERGTDVRKPVAVSRSLSLRIPEKSLPKTSFEGAQLRQVKALKDPSRMAAGVPTEAPSQVEVASSDSSKLPPSLDTPKVREIKHKPTSTSPKKFSLPQVYQECWNKSKPDPAVKPKDPISTPKLEPSDDTKGTISTSKKDQGTSPSFDRNSPQRLSIRRRKDSTNLSLSPEKIDITLPPEIQNSPPEIQNSPPAKASSNQQSEDLKIIIQDAVRSEMKKTVEEIGLGILGGAIGSLATSNRQVTNNQPQREGNSDETVPKRPLRRKESLKKIDGKETGTLPDIRDKSSKDRTKKLPVHSKVTRMKERRVGGSDGTTNSSTSTESDHSDSSDSLRNVRRNSVLHKVPLLKANDKERGNVSPKRYYVISDAKTNNNNPQRQGNDGRAIPPESTYTRRQTSHPPRLLKIDNKQTKDLNANSELKKTVDPDEVRRFVVAKSKTDEVPQKLEKKKLLSISMQGESKDTPTNKPHDGTSKPSVDDFKPRRQKSLGPKTAAKLARMDLKLALDEVKPLPVATEPETPMVVSPDNCAQLQYDVYERLRNAKDKNTFTNSTQTSLSLKDAGSSTSPKISHDIGLMTEAELENERIKVFQKVLTISKQTSISDKDAFEDENVSKQMENENAKYDEDSFNSNVITTNSSESMTSPQLSFCTKLDGLQKRLDSIDEVSHNLERELQNSKKAILDAENLANADLNLNLREKSPSGIVDWRKKESNIFEHRKSIILSLIDQKYKRALSNYETASDINDNTSERARRQISFVDNNPVDDSVIDSDQELRKTFVIRSRNIDIEDDGLIEPAKMRELYRIYGSRRIPDRVLQKIRSQYITKRQSSL